MYYRRLKVNEDFVGYLRISLACIWRRQVHLVRLIRSARHAERGFLSVVSFWEISLKHSLGKLPLPQPPAQFIPRQREKHLIMPLALEEAAVEQLSRLPGLHRDPFDRMLICQAKAHGLTLASSDSLVRQYPVALL
jgi:PIN domain nuclease of toxin-antitoxin system